MPIARLHLITPERLDVSVRERVEQAFGAGGRWLQVRTKWGSDRERLTAIAELVAIARAHGATALVNDRSDLAVAVEADGVHLGLDDLPVAAARRVLVPALGQGAIVGGTCRNADHARRAVDEGATYLGVGPVFATTTKSGLPDPIGLAGLAAVAAAVDVPVIAISGITVERVASVLDAGAHGVAVVGAVFDAPDPVEATQALLSAVGETVSTRPTGARPATAEVVR